MLTYIWADFAVMHIEKIVVFEGMICVKKYVQTMNYLKSDSCIWVPTS